MKNLHQTAALAYDSVFTWLQKHLKVLRTLSNWKITLRSWKTWRWLVQMSIDKNHNPVKSALMITSKMVVNQLSLLNHNYHLLCLYKRLEEMKILGLALLLWKRFSLPNAQQLVNGSILGRSMHSGPWLYHGVWNIKLINLGSWGYLHGAFMGYFGLNSWKVNSLSPVSAMAGTAILGVAITWLIVRFVIRLGLQPWSQPSGVPARMRLVFVGANTCSFRKWLKRFVTTSVLLQSPHLADDLAFSFLMVAFNLLFKNKDKAMYCICDSDAAQLMGINVNRTISFTFLLWGSGLGRCWWCLDWFVLQLDRAFDGDDTRDQSLCRSRLVNWIIPGAALGGFVIGLLQLAARFGLFRDFRDAIV